MFEGMSEVPPTSLSELGPGEWHRLSNAWSRGADNVVRKVGRKWAVSSRFGSFPLFTTKRAAWQAVTDLVLWESLHRLQRSKG